ncbi:L-iditol 2-dehydrogenase [Lachnospiraceae bacterium]|nr:L-iditol 2-dehydrogenase [Lachnospiraceae bacterium]
MKAYVLHDINDLRFEDVQKPVPSPGEVLLKVSAAGICGSDIPRIYDTGAHVHPLIPGHEFSGIVEELGNGADESLSGKRVGVFPLIPCMECDPCRHGKYEMCRHYSYIGSRRDGAFAEYVAVPSRNVIVIPDEISMETAAMLEPMAVAVHAMRRGFKTCEIINGYAVVFGMGTIGLMLTAFLLDAGVDPDKLLAIGNKSFQREMALEIGVKADNFYDIREGDTDGWINEKTDGRGVELTFECVGKNVTVVQAVDHASPSGRIVFVGNPHSDMDFSRDVYWKILRNQLKITGTWNSSFTGEKSDDWHYVLDRLKKGTIKPEKFITHRFSLNELHKGFKLMRDKSEPYVKVMGIML